MKRFDVMLENEICGYEGEFADLISQAPAFYKLMTRLLDDPDLPKPLSPHIIAAIAYFILPEDIIPEDKFGPVGYVDDIYLCAFVAKGVLEATGSPDILSRNWDGKRPVIQLIEEILDREKELLGNKKERMMQYIGFDEI